MCPIEAVDTVLRPLFKSLLLFEQQHYVKDPGSIGSNMAVGDGVMATEEDILSDVQLLAILVTAHPLSGPVVSCLFRARLVSAVFSLGSFMYSSHPLCDMKQIVLSICSEIVKHADALEISQCLEDVMTRTDALEFASGPGGGVVIRHTRQNALGNGVSLLSLLGGVGSGSGGALRTGMTGAPLPAEEEYAEVMRALMLSSALAETDPEGNACGTEKSVATMMSNIVRKAKGICELLVGVYPSNTGQGGDVLRKRAATGTSTGQKKSRASVPGHKTSHLDDQITEEESSGPLGHLPSVMFIRMLRAYLGVDSVQFKNQDGSHQSREQETELAPHVCGMLLLVIKSHIPLTLLLEDGACDYC
jgi:hypothetical protein